MMVDKSKIDIDFDKYFKKIQDKIKFQGKLLVKAKIKTTIKKGLSPVKGQKRFMGYADSYKKQIKKGKLPGKKQRPVNMTITGKMVNSLKVINVKTGFSVFFTDKKAEYHNDLGVKRNDAPGGKVFRRLIPNRSGEEFSKTITKPLIKLIKNIVSTTNI